LLWIAVGIGACGVLATLSKANGVLLPLLVLALEASVLRANPRLRADLQSSRRLRAWLAFWLLLPALVLAAYLLWQVQYLHDDIWNRPWTRAQRLLTQPRILLDYLGLLLVPRVVTAGLFNDGIVASIGLLSPLSTLWSLLGLAALLVTAFVARRRAPVLSGALLFFFAGHLLESTIIPLELYFEHRNYLPSMLLFWAIAWWVAHEERLARFRPVVALLAIVLLASTLRSRAELWSQPVLQAKLWALAAPESARAQSHASMLEISAGEADKAVVRMRAAWQAQPMSLQVALNYANTACEVDGLTGADNYRLAGTFRRTKENGTIAPRWLEKAVTVAALHQCAGLALDDVDRFAASALENPALNAIPGRRMDLRSIRGMVAIERGDPLRALALFDEALAEYPNPSTAARQSAALASRGWPSLGLRHLDYFDTIKPLQAHPRPGMAMLQAWVLDKQGYWANEEAVLRQKMHEDIAAGKDQPVVPPAAGAPVP
ncbi:MAG: tetratricopeptide repeat protein, partial [Arenimonas sp.]